MIFFEIFLFKSFQEYVNQRLPAQRPTDGSFWKTYCFWSHILKIPRVSGFRWAFSPAHVEPSVASFFRSAPVRGSVVNLLIYLADQLTRRFQFVDNQFQALQTQVIEGVQSLHSWLQELEANVAQIQPIVRISLHHLVQWISRIWCFEDFCSSLYQLFYKLMIIWAFYSSLFSYVWTLELFNCCFSILC